MKFAAISCLVWLFFNGPCLGQQTRYAGDPLLLGAGARPQGMGNAFVALADDASAIYWNPAGLIMLRQREIHLQHAEQFGGSVNHDVLTLGLPVGHGGFGMGVVRLGVDDIALTHLEDPARPLGPDNRPVISRIVGTTEYTLHVAYARAIRSNLSLGATAKLIRRNLGQGSGSGFAFDLGLLYAPHQYLKVGALLHNVTRTRITFDTGARDHIPPSLLFGVASTIPVAMLKGTVTGSFSLHAGEEKSDIEDLQGTRFGLEYWLQQRIALRIGLQDGHLTLGTGLQTRRFSLDLAFIEHAHLNNTYRISASIYF